MKGTYRGEERELTAKSWREEHHRNFVRHEVEPLGRFISGDRPLTVVDVGANKGWFAKGMLQLYPINHIHMFDPSPENCAELSNRESSMIFDQGDFDKLSVYQFALGDRPGKITLHTNDDGSPLASIYDHVVAGEASPIPLDKSIDVQMETLDWFLSRKVPLDHVDILKVDTEGAEFSVFKGAENMLRNGMVDFVHFEFGEHQVSARNFFSDFYEMFKDLGFQMYHLHEGTCWTVDKYSRHYEQFGSVTVFLAQRIGSTL